MKKTTTLIIALMLMGILTAGAVSAYKGWGNGNTAARDAVKAGDFAAWKAAVQADLTEEHFNQLVERQQQMGERQGRMMQDREAMDTIFESGDFEAWKELMESRPGQSDLELTEETFAKMQEMHTAMEDGDFETANSIREELGMSGGFGMHGGHKGGGMRGFGGNEGCPLAAQE